MKFFARYGAGLLEHKYGDLAEIDDAYFNKLKFVDPKKTVKREVTEIPEGLVVEFYL